MDGRDECLARGHDRRLFGDIIDGFGLGQVYCCDLVGGEEDAVLAVGCARPYSDGFAAEGFRDSPELALEADVPLVVPTRRTISPSSYPTAGGRSGMPRLLGR